MEYMDKDSKNKMEKSIQILKDFFSDLEGNTIKMQHLQIALTYSENLRNIADQIQKISQFQLPLTPDTLTVILECRRKDWKILKDRITIVESLGDILRQVQNCEYIILDEYVFS